MAVIQVGVPSGPPTWLDAKRVFYYLMRLAYDKVYGRQHMLHYPLYKNGSEDLMQGQIHFTDHCISHLPVLSGKRLLEIGCGNGLQTMYIHLTYSPEYTFGIDINSAHIEFAAAEKERRRLEHIDFAADDAQILAAVRNDSFDVVICTESAHHYPDKLAFLQQVKRVLRPGGFLLVADLLRRDGRDPSPIDRSLSLFYWSRSKYQEAFASVELSLLVEEDLTNLILRAFADAKQWFGAGAKVGPSFYFGKLFGRALIRLYALQLRRSLQYQLMLCRRS